MIRRVTTDAGVLEVRDCGRETDPPVVLLHGFPQDSRCWNAVEPLLHEAGLRTLAPDQRGYSPQASPRDVQAYRMRALTADVIAVLDALDLEKAHVVGHDWGGAVAWGLGAAFPDRVASLTVLSTPHPRALLASMTRSAQPLRSWYTLAFQLPVLPEFLLSQGLVTALRLSGLPLHLAREYGERFSSPDELFGPLAWYRAAVRRPVWQQAKSVESGSAAVTVPTTHVWGSKDFALGRAAAELTADYVVGDYRFVELDAGHWLPEVHPDVVAEAIIDRVGSGR